MEKNGRTPDAEEAEQAPSGGHGEQKERMKEQAIAALLDQPSIARAARALGIAENTLGSWMKDAAFQKDDREARNQALSHAIDRLQGSTGKAVETLLTLMDGEDVASSTRLSAARIVMDTHFKVLEAQKMEERVTKVEDFIREEISWD